LGNNRKSQGYRGAIYLIFPFGEWLLFSLSLLSLTEWRMFRIDRGLRILPFIWILGLILENIVTIPGIWHWHFSRLFVLLGFVIVAYKYNPGRKVLSLVLTSLTFLVQDLFLINEPGIFKYDQWTFAIIVSCISYFSAQSLWGMGFALAGSMLLSLWFSVFFFDGIVRHFDLPDPFFWHFGIALLTGMAALKQIRAYFRINFRKSKSTGMAAKELVSDEIDSLKEQEPTVS
jgi:hypothetical protein